jgi:hypothetical protein
MAYWMVACSVYLYIAILGGEYPHLPLSGKKSDLGPARIVIRRGRANVQAFHGLTGDPGDEVEVLIEVQYGQPGEFSSSGDDQIRY